MKYVGGKSRLVNNICQVINDIAFLHGINNYYEPFCGGCAIGENVNILNKYCSDCNVYLIALLKQAQLGLPDFKEISKEVWSDVRLNIKTGKYPDWFIGYCGFMCSFRGV